MNNYNYNELTPFKWFILENFPLIDEDFDALTNWQLFCKLGKEINKIIDSQNNVGEQMENVTNAYIALQNYVANYFANLDVQDEINNKLDEMADSGELGHILEVYLEPQLNSFKAAIEEDVDEKIAAQDALIDNQNTTISNLEDSTAATLDSFNLKLNQMSNTTPIVVTDASQMTDTSKIYVLTTDGKWYYYNGSAFVVGGTYQSTGIADNSLEANQIDITTLRAFLYNKEINMFNKNNIKANGFYNNGNWVSNNDYSSTEFIPVISKMVFLKNATGLCYYDGTKTYLGNTWSSSAVYLTAAINTANVDLDNVNIIFNGSYQPQATYLEIIENPLLMNKEVLNAIYQNKIINLFNTNEYVTGGFYNHNNNGNFVSNANFASTGLIPVINGNIYTNGANHRCFYDKDLVFVGSNYTSNAYYMREAINLQNSSVAATMVCFNGTPTNAIDFLEFETITPESKLENKTISLVGDSMVTDGYAPWKTIFANTYNTTFNTPVGGHGGDITVFSQYINTINTNCDFVIVWAGTNDWYHGQPMGSLTDAPSYGVNVLASWKYVLEYISTNMPTKKVLAITPSPRWYKVEDTPNVNQYGENINSEGYSLRELSDNIEKLCNLYSIPCINMMNVASWNKNNYTTYLADGIHQNSVGGNNVAILIASYLTNYIV